MSAALEVLAQLVQTPGQQRKLTWTKRPGGVTIALTLDKVQVLLRKGAEQVANFAVESAYVS